MSLINDALKRASQMERVGAVPRPAGPALQPVQPPSATLVPRPVLLGVGGTVVLALASWMLWQWFQGMPVTPKPADTVAGAPARGSTKTDATKTAAAGPTGKASVATGEAGKVLGQASDSAKAGMGSLANAAKSAAATLKGAVAGQTEPTPVKVAPRTEAVRVAAVNPAAATSGGTAPTPTTTPAAALIPPAVVAAVSKPAGVPAPSAAPRLLDPVAPAPQPFPPLRLQGVIYRASNASAFINGRVLFVGDKIEEAVLTKVDRQSVTFEMGGQTKVVQLAR